MEGFHTGSKTNKNVGPANTAYTTYLRSELKTHNDSIAADNPTKDDCIKSLEALGRVTHSWQDYYAHAVLMNGKAGPAWSATPQITGSPDNLNPQLKPSSWGGVVMAANPWGADEHGASEPASRDGQTGEKLRYNDANTYVTGRLQALYPPWEKKCACYFKK